MKEFKDIKLNEQQIANMQMLFNVAVKDKETGGLQASAVALDILSTIENTKHEVSPEPEHAPEPKHAGNSNRASRKPTPQAVTELLNGKAEN